MQLLALFLSKALFVRNQTTLSQTWTPIVLVSSQEVKTKSINSIQLKS